MHMWALLANCHQSPAFLSACLEKFSIDYSIHYNIRRLSWKYYVKNECPRPMPVVLPFCNFNHGHLLNSWGLIFNLSNLCNMEVFRSDCHSFLLSVFTLHFYYSETLPSEKITFRSICFIYSLSHLFLIRLKTTQLACIFLDMFILLSR